jgi:hypothetical protein
MIAFLEVGLYNEFKFRPLSASLSGWGSDLL